MPSFSLTDFIKENGDLFCKVQGNTENLNEKVFKTKNGRLIMKSNCAESGISKSTFAKEQEANGLLSNLGIKTPLSKIPLLNALF